MKLKKYVVAIFYTLSSTIIISAQYKEPEKKDKIEALYPNVSFDSLLAKQELAKGTATIKGIAFTKAKIKWGLKMGQRIYANLIKVTLFPVTSFQEYWFDLRKDKESLRKDVTSIFPNLPTGIGLDAINNSEGEFIFPDMKVANISCKIFRIICTTEHIINIPEPDITYTADRRITVNRSYSVDHADRIEAFVEVKTNSEII